MSKRIVYLDLLRIFACIAVIVIHVSASNMEAVAIGSSAWRTFNIYDSFARLSVPAFVMITGMFMLDTSKALTMKQLYLNYVLKMLALWIVWELFYALVHFSNMNYTLNAESLSLFIKTVYEGHFHLWYLPMLVGLYISTPILRAITEKDDRKLIEYFILLFFVPQIYRASTILQIFSAS